MFDFECLSVRVCLRIRPMDNLFVLANAYAPSRAPNSNINIIMYVHVHNNIIHNYHTIINNNIAPRDQGEGDGCTIHMAFLKYGAPTSKPANALRGMSCAHKTCAGQKNSTHDHQSTIHPPRPAILIFPSAIKNKKWRGTLYQYLRQLSIKFVMF